MRRVMRKSSRSSAPVAQNPNRNLYRSRVQKCQDYFTDEREAELECFFSDVSSYVPDILLQVLCETRNSNCQGISSLVSSVHVFSGASQKGGTRNTGASVVDAGESKQEGLASPKHSSTQSAYQRLSTNSVWDVDRGSSLAEAALAPTMFRTEGACMLADISGFCRMSEKLCEEGPEGMQKLIKIINECFTVVLQTIEKHGGDVQKFAGDALLITWMTQRFANHNSLHGINEEATYCDENNDESGSPKLHSIRPEQAALASVKCGLELAGLVLPHPGLLLHIGVAFGSANVFVIGGSRDEWHTVIAGSRFQEMGIAVELAKSKEVVVSSECYALIQHCGEFHAIKSPYGSDYDFDDKSVSSGESSCSEECEVISRDTKYYLVQSLHDNHNVQGSNLDPETGEIFSFKVPQPLRHELLESLLLFLPHTVDLEIDNPRPCTASESEMRDVTVIFVSMEGPRIQSLLAGVPALGLVQECLAIALGSLHRFNVMLRQFIVDDKGVVLIGALGVPGFAHIDDASRGVECSLEINSQLNEISVFSYVGIASGTAFCGLVGNTKRHEYAIVGDVVNLSARLMSLSSKRAMIHAPPNVTEHIQAKSPTLTHRRTLVTSIVHRSNSLESEATSHSFNRNRLNRHKSEVDAPQAKRGYIMCDENTFERAQDSSGLEFRKQDRVKLKGKEVEIQVYQVVRSLLIHRFHDSKSFVGFEDQKRMVSDTFQKRATQGTGSVVTVLGPMGSGKSSFVGAASNQLVTDGAKVSYISPKSPDIHRPFSTFVMLFWLISNTQIPLQHDGGLATSDDKIDQEEEEKKSEGKIMGDHPVRNSVLQEKVVDSFLLEEEERSRLNRNSAGSITSVRRTSFQANIELGSDDFVDVVMKQWESTLTQDELLLKGEVCRTILQIQQWKVSDWRPMNSVNTSIQESNGVVCRMLLKLLLCPLCQVRLKSCMYIVIDNGQFVDKQSWVLLVNLLDKIPSILLMIAFPTLTDGTLPDHLSSRQMRDIRSSRNQNLHEVIIKPMDPEMLEKMLTIGFPDHTWDSDTIQLLHEIGQGNPFVCKELARSMVEEAEDQRSHKTRSPTNRNVKSSTIILPSTADISDARGTVAETNNLNKQSPTLSPWANGAWSISLEKAFIGRIDRRSKAEQHILKVASVVGGEFEYDLVREIIPRRYLRVSEGRTLLDNVLLNLVRDDLLIEQDKCYQFTHEILRLTCYNLLMKEDQISYHKQVAHWISSTFQDDLRPFFVELSQHLDAAQVYDRAAEYALGAINSAVFVEAFDDAIFMLNKIKEYTRMETLKKRKKILRMCLRELGELKLMRPKQTPTNSFKGSSASARSSPDLRRKSASFKRNSIQLRLVKNESKAQLPSEAKNEFWLAVLQEIMYIQGELNHGTDSNELGPESVSIVEEDGNKSSDRQSQKSSGVCTVQ